MTQGEEGHIAVLFCDKPIPDLVPEFGDLGDMCVDLVNNSGCKYPGKKYTVHYLSEDEGKDERNLNQAYLELLGDMDKGVIKGIVISGSGHDSFAEELWIQRLDEFLRNVVFIKENFPIVGICFGHQIIAKNLGSKVGRNTNENGWECGIATISLNREIFSIENKEFLSILKNNEEGVVNEHLNLPEFHRDIVYGLPSSTAIASAKKSNFLSIGSTSKCSIQGLITGSGPLKVLTFQGHPEFSKDFIIKFLNYKYEKGLLEKNVYEKSLYNSQILNNQNELICALIGKFINSLA